VSYDYSRYLAAKVSVDDRALNRTVLDELRRLLRPRAPLVLEVGAGLGTMVGRLLDWQVLDGGDYTLLDVDDQLLRDSREWLLDWGAKRGLGVDHCATGLRLGRLRVHFVQAELSDYLQGSNAAPVDLLIANALLDLVDVPVLLPELLRLLRPDGLYWFTINYDGESIFEPGHPCDDDILRAYHRDMDERVRYGRPAGESRTGRHLFSHLRRAGAPAVSAGSSDWLVHAGPDGRYPNDEAYFLRCILATIGDALMGRVNAAELAGWLADRTAQLEAGELVYLAHQLDFVGGRTAGGEKG
jgi:SAM-dependent methyltransferase